MKKHDSSNREQRGTQSLNLQLLRSGVKQQRGEKVPEEANRWLRGQTLDVCRQSGSNTHSCSELSAALKEAVSGCRLQGVSDVVNWVGRAEEKMDVLPSHRVIEISMHLIVQLVNGVDGRGEVEEEFPDFFQALLVLDLPTFGEGLQEVWLIRRSEKSCLKRSKKRAPHLHTTQRVSYERESFVKRRWTHPEELLHPPAVVLLQGYFVGFGDVDSDEVWVAVILFAVHQALKEDLDKSKTPGC